MPPAYNLRLNISDATTLDTLRGPGSSSTEQIPSTSSILSSPFHSYRHERLDESNAALEESNVYSGLGTICPTKDPLLHIVVVGGNVGAFATALALAKSEQIRVTLVNVGVGPLTVLGSESGIRGSLLTARTVEYLDELGKWEGSYHYDQKQDAPFDLEGRTSRWKGRGLSSESVSIAEAIREEGYCLKTFQFQRYVNGEELVHQEYAISSGEDVSMFAIDTNMLLTLLRDFCISHPRIDVRPRGILRAVLPGTIAHPSSRRDVFQGQDSGNGKSSTSMSRRRGVSEPLERIERTTERRRKARESFIQLDDDDHDDAFQFSFAGGLPSMLLSSADVSLSELLRNLPSHTGQFDLFSPKDLPSDLPSSATSSHKRLDEEYNPVVILTSGEQLAADAVLSSEGPDSKVLDAIRKEGNCRRSRDIVREDGIFRTTITMTKLLQDRELQSLTRRLVTWIGPGRFLTTYSINDNLLHVVLTVEGGRAREDDEDVIVARQMKSELIGWCPIVTKLASLIDSALYEPVFDYNPLEKWVSESGRVAMVGSAAHPLLPFAHQALSTTVSDALTLGALFRKALVSPPKLHPDFKWNSSHFVPRLLHAFESLRRPHCLRTQLTLREGRNLLLLPDDEHQKSRDKMLKKCGLLSEKEKRVEWLFDPFEEVERWWANELRSVSLGR